MVQQSGKASIELGISAVFTAHGVGFRLLRCPICSFARWRTMSPDAPDINHQSRGGHDQRHAYQAAYWELAALTAEGMFGQRIRASTAARRLRPAPIKSWSSAGFGATWILVISWKGFSGTQVL